MVKQVFLDGGAKKLIDELCDSGSWEVGILVGHCTKLKDYIVHFAKTPLEFFDRVKGLAGLSDVAVSSHAVELNRMLTGGFSICGLGVVASQADVNAANIKIHQIMQSCYKKLETQSRKPQPTDTWHFISTDSRISKLNAKQLQVSDYKSSMQNSDVKIQSLDGGWLSVDTSLPINQTFYIKRHDEDKDFEKQIMGGLAPLRDSITNASYIINGSLLEDDAEVGEAKGSKKSSHSTPAVKNLTVQLLTKPPCAEQTSCDDCVARIQISGAVSSRSLLKAPALVSDLRQAVSSDLSRSAELHIQLLCEDILQVGSEKHIQELELIYETPLRVYIKLNDKLPVTFSDFLFRDENVEDCIERASHILGLTPCTLTKSHVDVSRECIATEVNIENLRCAGNDSDEEQEITEPTAVKSNSNIKWIGAMASGAVLALALSFPYLNMEEWFS